MNKELWRVYKQNPDEEAELLIKLLRESRVSLRTIAPTIKHDDPDTLLCNIITKEAPKYYEGSVDIRYFPGCWPIIEPTPWRILADIFSSSVGPATACFVSIVSGFSASPVTAMPAPASFLRPPSSLGPPPPGTAFFGAENSSGKPSCLRNHALNSS